MSIFTALGQVARHLRDAHARHATERAIAELSPELRKDIGWPDAGDRRVLRRHPSFDRWI